MKALVWIRRDLRLKDHHALAQATHDAQEVHLVFNFDPHLLNPLPKDDRRITFIIESLKDLEEQLVKQGSTLWMTYGNPSTEISALVDKLKINRLYYNHDYGPYAKKRDAEVKKHASCDVFNFKDSVVFEGGEVLNNKGEIYKVFTPFKRAWYEKLALQDRELPLYKANLKNLVQISQNTNSIINRDWYKVLGLRSTENLLKGGEKEAHKRLMTFEKIMMDYEQARDFPSPEVEEGRTSNLSAYIRHGNVSIRDMFRSAFAGSTTGHQIWASELIWREFYMTILDQFPHVAKRPFRPEYEGMKWIGGKKELEAWKQGQTGFPLIDAAMRCLNETGMMHNRLRMVVASFLCKTLLVNWKRGEEYFALKLLDFDLAANNGGWQWCSSTGTDAQPYFRIFNPYNQSMKFDPKGEFIKRWCPELAGFSTKLIHNPTNADMIEQAAASCTIGVNYPYPIVEYKAKRDEALAMYKAVK